MARYTLALLLFAFPAALTAQEPAGEPEAKELSIVLEEPAKTVKEALGRRVAKEAIAQKELTAAQKAFDENMAAIDRHTVSELSTIARLAVADGKLGEAAEAWTEVERLDPENEQAKAFFKVVGREESSTKKPTRIRGDNRRVWLEAATRKPLFAVQPNGNWIQFMAGNQTKEWAEVDRLEGIIFMRRPDGMELRLHQNAFYWKASGSNSWLPGPIGYWR